MSKSTIEDTQAPDFNEQFDYVYPLDISWFLHIPAGTARDSAISQAEWRKKLVKTFCEDQIKKAHYQGIDKGRDIQEELMIDELKKMRDAVTQY